ncbi:unnamed protein product [Rotaria sordida]|uniref:Uncharacterized protein n=1 Tax=Rotaria sordida TaxID=392033 RepID=A0A816CNI0_9BILA|nr:unnamed protein product [Rotaria sordida]CAF1623498.1 unnamed protein product [Rotaria sordida]
MIRNNLRRNRPQAGDGYFKKLHVGEFSNNLSVLSKKKGPAKTRWLRGIAAHLQQVILRATADRAKGEKRIGKISLSNTAVVAALENIGIKNKWIECPTLIEMLHLDTCFIKGDYLQKSNRLEFKHFEKVCYYFDSKNISRQTGIAHFLYFRLLKETVLASHIN